LKRRTLARVIAVALLATTLVGAIGPGAADAAPTLPVGFVQDVVASGLTYPTAMTHLPDGRILVLEKDGKIRVIKNGALLATPFADLTAKVNNYWDRGLTAIAVDPSFATNGYLYLYYTYDSTGGDGSGPLTNRLVRITASGDVMLPGSETVILGSIATAGCSTTTPSCMPQDFYGHAPDSLRFAPDGTLFLSTGDASSWDIVDDRALRSQDIDQYPGKILRITTDGKGLATNPFWNGDPDAIRSKVWSYGLRNPFRMNLRPGTSTPYVGDVGWADYEEIDIATPGANFGWPCYEGNVQQTGYKSKPLCQALYAQGPSAVKAPMIVWSHNGRGAAGVGGPFTPSTSTFPSQYQDGFFYADYALNWIRFAKVDSNGDLVGTPTDFATNADGPVDLSFGADGFLYYVAINAGVVRRIRPSTTSGTSSLFLSDLTPTSATNGWGPYERDKSNGEQLAGDGKTLTINGTTYTKGLGTHAAADLRYTIPDTCTFTAQIGIDDEVVHGTVIFEVWNGTTTRLYQSPTKTYADGPTAVSVPLSGVTNLRLVADTTADGAGSDHADWGDAKITCTGTDTTPPAISAISAVPSSATAAVSWTTDEPSSSQVDYGTTTGYGASTTLDSRMVLNHGQNLSGLTAGTLYHYRVRSTDAAGNTAVSTDRTFTTGSGTGTATYLSDLVPISAANGWGPYERDRSNGEQAAGDGKTLTINGTTYTKGLGTHAAADLRYTIPNDCTFTAQIGIDDEVVKGTVVFEVWNGTTTRLYQSGTKTSTDGPTAVSVPLAGVTNLRLVAATTADGNGSDHADWADAKITCGSSASSDPVPTISSPTANQTFAVGDLVQLSGSATDAEDGPIPASGLTWQVVLFHCPGGACHQHPFSTFSGPTASFTAPDHGDDSYIQVNLVATDSSGRTATATTTMQPRTVTFTLDTSPTGLSVIYGGASFTTPVQITTIVGGLRTVDVESPQSGMDWESWSDGGAQQHAITIPSTSSTLTATFDAPPGTSTMFLSDLRPTSATNGWGPYERDESNGEQLAGDGKPLTINGTTYAKGLGSHANADLRYTIPDTCTFTAQIGIDDEVVHGTVVFEVWNGTTTRLYQSPTKTFSDGPTAVTVPLSGVTNLRLVAATTADGGGSDHADWGDAKIACTGTDTTPPAISAISAVPSSATAAVSWTTDEPSSSQVDYGTTAGYGASTTLDSTMVLDHGQTISGLSANTLYHYRVRATDAAGNTAVSTDGTFTTASGTGVVTYLSDLVPTTAVNGYGPYERDKSNGNQAAGDGKTLTINGTTYTKGLGTHAAADLRYTIPNDCTFTAQIGIDDEVVKGTVVFEVWNGTTTRLYQSATKTSTDGPTAVSIPVNGVTNLRLVAATTPDGNGSDHADWGDAKITCSSSASPFAAPTSYTTGSHAHGVTIGDVNGDGKSDLLSVSAGTATMYVLLGNGNGGFGAPAAFATGSEPKTVALGDLNGDGKLDAVTANQGSSSVSVLLGNGDGTFQPRVDYASPTGSHEATIGDVDVDGKLDVAVVGSGPAGVLFGNGNGTFLPKVDVTVGTLPRSVAILDVNKDGKPDLAVANHDSNTVSIVLGDGNRTFQAAVNRVAGTGPHSLRTADLNGDGFPDLVVANDTSNNVTVFLGNGTASFGTSTTYATAPTPKSVAIADVDGDGKLDIAVATINGNYPNLVNPGGNVVSILRGNGNGTFQARQDHWVGQGPFSVAFGLLDGDAKLDLVTANWHDGGLTVRLATPS
jgi:glucose/arabinose dehydrogenase